MATPSAQRARSALERSLVGLLPPRVVYALAERRYRRQEPELRHLESFVDPARGAVDIGAWLGPWTRALSRHATHVHAFEPQPRLAAHLRRVVAPNVTVHQAAVGSARGSATLLVDPRPGRDATAAIVGGGAQASTPVGADPVEVEVVRLDDLELGDVGFIKIDVEGYELSVLDGASHLLATCRPALLVEVEQRHLDVPVRDVFDRLLGADRDGWFLLRGRWRPLGQFDLEEHQRASLTDVRSGSYVNSFLFTAREPRGP